MGGDEVYYQASLPRRGEEPLRRHGDHEGCPRLQGYVRLSFPFQSILLNLNSTQMFKKRIMRWKLRKYSSKEEKHSALAHISAPEPNIGSSNVTVNGVIIKAATLHRYAKRRKHVSRHALLEKAGRLEAAPRSTALIRRSCSPARPLNGAADATSVEYVLWAIQGYANKCFESGRWVLGDNDTTWTDPEYPTTKLSEQISVAFQSLHAGYHTLATIVLSSIGNDVRAALEAQHISIWQVFFHIVTKAGDKFLEHKKAVLELFWMESQAMHGRHHPLSILLSFMRLAEATKLHHSNTMITFTVRNSCRKILGWDHNKSIELELEISGNNINGIRETLSECDTHLGKYSGQALFCLYRLSTFLFSQKDFVSLETVIEELFERSAQASIAPRKVYSLSTSKIQASMKYECGEWAPFEQIARHRVLPSLAEYHGIDSAQYVDWCRCFVYCLQKQEKWVEAHEAQTHLSYAIQLLQQRGTT